MLHQQPGIHPDPAYNPAATAASHTKWAIGQHVQHGGPACNPPFPAAWCIRLQFRRQWTIASELQSGSPCIIVCRAALSQPVQHRIPGCNPVASAAALTSAQLLVMVNYQFTLAFLSHHLTILIMPIRFLFVFLYFLSTIC